MSGCEPPDVVVGLELQSSERLAHAFNCCAIFPVPLESIVPDNSSGSSLHTQDKQDHQEEGSLGTPIQNCSSDLLASLSLMEHCFCTSLPSIVFTE